MSIPRGASTPESRLSVAAAEYEREARGLGHVPMPRRARAPHVNTPGGGSLTVAGDSENDSTLPDSATDDGTLERIVYGLGRAYERAIQEARGFETVDVGRVSR